MVDRIQVGCPGCQKTLALPHTTAGKRIQCPQCSAVVPVPKATLPPRKPQASRTQHKTSPPKRQPKKRSASNDRLPAHQPKKRKRTPVHPTEELWPETPASQTAAAPPLPAKRKKRKKESSKPRLAGTGNEPPPISRGKKLTMQERIVDRGGILGLFMSVGSLVLFIAGLSAGVIFYVAPAIFILGLIKFARAMFDD